MSGDLRGTRPMTSSWTRSSPIRARPGPGALFIAVVGRPTTVTITSPRHWVQGVSRRSSAVRCPVRILVDDTVAAAGRLARKGGD